MPAHPLSRLVRFMLADGTSAVCSTRSAIGGLQFHPVRKVEAVELLACHVFNMADRDDRSVSMEMVRTRLARLREHPFGCCQLCAAAAKVAPADVYRIASAWQRQTTITRLRALR